MTKVLSGKLPEMIRKYKYPGLILALGLVLMLVPNEKKAQTVLEATPQAQETQERFNLRNFTKDTETLLGTISGAGEVRVLFTLDTDGEVCYLSDETSITEDGTRELRQETVLATVQGDETPVSLFEVYPVFRGALVLSQGAENPQVVLGIKEAISSLTGLGMDKITVLKMD